MNNLLVSWNFDLLKSSDEDGNLEILDTSNNNVGVGVGFNSLDASFISKEDIKSYRQIPSENLSSHDSINIYGEEDLQVNEYDIPSSTKIVIENSMYQIISDEIMNMFSTIDNYSFKFSEFSNKYKSNYKKLEDDRVEFFSKVLEKPDVEKYIEFYKWIDSSLGYMIDQLIPENSRTDYGLKNTIESHALERNKYKHKLPLTISHNRNFSSGIDVVKKELLSNSAAATSASFNDMKYLSTSAKSFVDDTSLYNVENINDVNYKKRYEYLHTAGKKLNNRGSKTNKTVFKTVFSTPDKNSHHYRDEGGEYSAFNGVNQNSSHLRKPFNITQSLSTPYASTRSVDDITYGVQGYNDYNNFIDNNFVQRNIPYTASNYYTTGGLNYQRIPNAEVRFMHDINLLLDVNSSSYDNSVAIIEPPIQFCLPFKQKLQVNTAFENIEVYSPYSTQLDYFSLRNIKKHNYFLINRGYLLDNKYPLDDKITFYRKSLDNAQYLTFYSAEHMNVVYPRTDMIGLAEIRTKSRYEEEEGIPLTASITSPNINLKFDAPAKIQLWSENSYNNMPILNRSFWHDNIEDRKRTRGADVEYLLPGTGALNTLGFPSLSESNYSSNSDIYNLNHQRNATFSVNSLDCRVDYNFQPLLNTGSVLSCSNEVYGELSPYSHINLAYLNNYLPDQFTDTIKMVPKLSFIQNNFIDFSKYSSFSGKEKYQGYILNKSYQSSLDCRIKPWYDNYEEYRENIKHKSQDMSIIPEFIVSKHENIIKKQINTKLFKTVYVEKYNEAGQLYYDSKNIPNYLTINGHERYEQIRQEDFKVDLKNFIDKKSNKIKFKLRGVKKLLPYNGFYPQERTVQIAGLFNQEYLNDTGFAKDVDKLDIDYDMSLFAPLNVAITSKKLLSATKALVVNQPFFSPGILFNTIKSGISLPWKTYATSSYSEMRMPKYDNFEFIKENELSSDSYYVTGANYVFPFQSLLNPEEFFRNTYNFEVLSDYLYADPTPEKSFCIPYLDPTHHSQAALYNLYIGTSEKYCKALSIDNISKYFKQANPILYKSSINNFLSETAYFFLREKNASRLGFLQSTSGSVDVKSGSVYSMNLVLESRDGFSMFNKYSTIENNFVPSASLFGPPVLSSSADGAYNYPHSSNEPYYPYCPPYMYSSKDIYTFIYNADEDKTITIKELLSSISGSYDTFNNEAPNLKHRVTLKDCFYTNLNYSNSWVIQPKFEVPVLDFNGCSAVESGSIVIIPTIPS